MLLLIWGAIVNFIYPMFKATVFELPVLTFMIGQIGVLITLAFLFYEKGSLAQQVKVFFLMLFVSSALGALSNFLGQANTCTFVPGMTIAHIALKISWAQMLVMTMGALTVTIWLCKLAPITYIADPDVLNKLKGKSQAVPVITDDQPQESEVDWDSAKDASDLMPKPKPSSSQTGLNAARTSHTKLTGMDAESAPTPVAATPASSSSNSAPAAPTAQAQEGGQYTDRRGTGAKPSSTADRLQAQKRRNTSTFTKLQALSASGTGSLRKPTALEQSEEQPQSLSTLLNRLDDEDDTPSPPAASATPVAKPITPAAPPPEPIQPPEEILITTLFGEEAQLGLDAPEQTEAGFSLSSAMDRLAAQEDELTGIEVAEPAQAAGDYALDEPVFNTAQDVAPQVEPAVVVETAVVEETVVVEQTAFVEQTAVVEQTASVEQAPVVEPVVEPEPAAPAAAAPEPVAAAPEPVAAAPAQPPKQQPISVAAGLVQHTSPLAAKESADPGIAPSLMSLLDSAAERAGIDETVVAEAPAEVPPQEVVAEPTPEPVAQATPEPEVIPAVEPVAQTEESEPEPAKLFNAALDSDLDDVFSNLAPPEAQKQVAPSAEPALPSIESSEIQAKQEGLFGQEVGSEIDEIFSDLTPPVKAQEHEITGDHRAIVAAEPATSESPAPVTAEPPVVAQEAEEEQNKGLFEAEALSNEIDDIFSGLASPEAQREVSDVLGKQQKQPEPDLREAEPEPTDESKGLFQEAALNTEIDDIFSGLAPADAQREVSKEALTQLKGSDSFEPDEPGSLSTGELPQPAIPAKDSLQPAAQANKSEFTGTGDVPVLDVKVQTQIALNPRPNKPSDTLGSLPSMPAEAILDPTPAAAPADSAQTAQPGKPGAAVTPPKEVKEFGRLSNRSSVQPKVSGEGAGTMKTIGKLLLDTQAVENIIQAGQTKRPIGSGLTTARVISATRGEGIKALLTRIDTYPGVAGSLIVGHDGLVIASTITGMDKDMLGALSTALLSTSNLTTKKLEIGKLRQMVLLTELQNADGSLQAKTTVLTDVDVGILAVFLEQTELEKLDGLIVEIHETING